VPSALIVVLLLAFSAVAAACGGGGGEALTLEEYFQEMEAIMSEAEERFYEVIEEFGQQLNPPDVEQRIDAYQDITNEVLSHFEQVAESIDALNPPELVRGAHNAAVEASDDIPAGFQDFLDQLQDVESEAEL
jgi:Mn-containing catalase